MATNDDIIREIGEVKDSIKEVRDEIRGLKEKRLDINKLVQKLLNPAVIVSFAVLLGAIGIVGGKALEVSGFGISISTTAPESRANEAAVEASDYDLPEPAEDVAPEEPETYGEPSYDTADVTLDPP